VVVANVLPGGTKATLLIGEGTPGLTYGVSFLAVVAPSQRRKAIDLLVCVGMPLAEIVLAPTPPAISPTHQTITGNFDLAIG
jgi:hypothetical protein